VKAHIAIKSSSKTLAKTKLRDEDDQGAIEVVADSNQESVAEDQKTVQVITQIESDATNKALEATGAIA